MIPEKHSSHSKSHNKGHAHSHSRGPGGHHNQAGKNLLIAFLLNFSFALIELAGGLLTGSVAILADAVHDFGDSLTLGISIVLEKLSLKKRTDNYTYGHRRLSLLSSLIAGIVILIGSGIVLYEAIPQFWQKTSPPNGPWMIALALLGLTVNGVAALRLSKGTSRNESMLSWHLIEDVMGWAAVLVGAIIITFTSWTWVDPLLACGVAIFVLFNVSKNLWLTFEIFMQKKPDDFDEQKLKLELQKIPGVENTHHIHAWSIDGETNIVSLHVEVNENFNRGHDSQALKSNIRDVVKEMGPCHVTIEIIEFGQLSENCNL